jgi:hypothetical protein
MVSTRERSINIVNSKGPKMLKGLLYWVQGVWPPLSWTSNSTGGESEPNLLGYVSETR